MVPDFDYLVPRPVFRTRARVGLLATAFISLWSGSAIAVTFDAVSFVSVEHGYTVQNGSLPAGITSRTSGPSITTERNSTIDAPDAALAADTSDITIGCSACTPPTPYRHVGQHRTNRADPTEFADAQFDITAQSFQDGGADVTAFAMGARDVTRSGLAQARIASSPAPANAQSGYSIFRTTTFENISNDSISFLIDGYFDAFLLSRHIGGDGFARASTTLEILFSGIAPSALSYFSTSAYDETATEIGAGANVTEGLFTTADGILGMQFTAGATALSGPGLTEASLTAEHDFLMLLTLLPGQSADMSFGFSQQNVVTFTPKPVPLPASGLLLIGGLGALAGLRWRRGRVHSR